MESEVIRKSSRPGLDGEKLLVVNLYAEDLKNVQTV